MTTLLRFRPLASRTAVVASLAACLASPAVGQAPVEDLAGRDQAAQRSQLKAGAAYRTLQQAQYDAKLAEQDVLNAREAQQAAQKHADEMKRRLDAATQALAQARRKEAQARKDYDEALAGVDRAFQKPPAK